MRSMSLRASAFTPRKSGRFRFPSSTQRACAAGPSTGPTCRHMRSMSLRASAFTPRKSGRFRFPSSTQRAYAAGPSTGPTCRHMRSMSLRSSTLTPLKSGRFRFPSSTQRAYAAGPSTGPTCRHMRSMAARSIALEASTSGVRLGRADWRDEVVTSGRAAARAGRDAVGRGRVAAGPCGAASPFCAVGGGTSRRGWLDGGLELGSGTAELLAGASLRPNWVAHDQASLSTFWKVSEPDSASSATRKRIPDHSDVRDDFRVSEVGLRPLWLPCCRVCCSGRTRPPACWRWFGCCDRSVCERCACGGRSVRSRSACLVPRRC